MLWDPRGRTGGGNWGEGFVAVLLTQLNQGIKYGHFLSLMLLCRLHGNRHLQQMLGHFSASGHDMQTGDSHLCFEVLLLQSCSHEGLKVEYSRESNRQQRHMWFCATLSVGIHQCGLHMCNCCICVCVCRLVQSTFISFWMAC